MSSKPKLRIGAVSYLNTKPLVWGLAERLPEAEIIYDLPSRLADQLALGNLDIALIPSVEFFQNPEYALLSNACIACRGPVWSVKLFSRVPPEKIESLALDEGSRTSAALTKIVLAENFGIHPKTMPLPIDAEVVTSAAHAILLIGDRAIHEPAGDWHVVWDLGDVWNRWTETSFVFAMWTVRPGLPNDVLLQVENALCDTRNAGIAHLTEIAKREAPAMQLTAVDCHRYLRENLHFFYGPREQRGLELFYELAVKHGLAPHNTPSPCLESSVT